MAGRYRLARPLFYHFFASVVAGAADFGEEGRGLLQGDCPAGLGAGAGGGR